MKAIVELTHFDRGMYAAKLEGTELYAVFEIFYICVPDAGDLLESEAFAAVGKQIYLDITKGCSIELMAQGLHDLGSAKSACLL